MLGNWLQAAVLLLRLKTRKVHQVSQGEGFGAMSQIRGLKREWAHATIGCTDDLLCQQCTSSDGAESFIL